MMRYTLLNIAFLAAAGIPLYLRRGRLAGKGGTILKLVGAILLATAIFDNVIIGLHLVSYHQMYLLGLYIFRAPLEDFAYTLGAIMLIPILWEDKS